ncbi:MAG: metalloprotease [Planctomycetota bacterium]
MFVEPQPTPADLEFEVLGIRVRVSAWFWVTAVLFGWAGCQALSAGDQRTLLLLLVIWAATVFGSIMVHELGHALAYRAHGQSSHVVLYHLGGLTIPDAWGRRHLRPSQRLVVSAAGPGAQLCLAASLIAALKAAGYCVPFPFAVVSGALGLYDGHDYASILVYALVFFVVSVNVLWPLLNLIPVPPLDGGQIVRDGLLALGVADAPRIAAFVGAATGAVVAWWGFSRNEPILGAMFAMLTASCVKSINAGSTPWRRWN